MLKILRRIALPIILGSSIASFADENVDVDYFEDEGQVLFKVRAFGIYNNAKVKNLPPATSQAPVPLAAILKNGGGGETATTIFFNDSIAAELSLGLQVYNIKNSHLLQIANNYNGDSSVVATKKKYLFTIPVALSLQYHVAPFGAIRPYIGGGYYGNYVIAKSSNFKMGNYHGPVAQIGVDFIAKDDTLITVDARKLFMKSKINYKGGVASDNSVKGKIKSEPLLLGVGFGFKF